MPLRCELSDFLGRVQGELFPSLEEAVGPLTAKMKQFITVVEMSGIAAHIPPPSGGPGRPPASRVAMARAFIAKAVLGVPVTELLIDRLHSDPTLRKLCGFERRSSVPDASTFSRAFAEFAAAELPTRVHEALIRATHKERLVEHVTRDATAIEAPERPVKVEPQQRCRMKVPPRRGEPGWERMPRLVRQLDMTLAEMVADLPRHCALARKPNARGQNNFWVGYKLHLDIADGGIPVAALLTSASLNDGQAAIPLATITSARIIHLYEVMDSAYDAPQIRSAIRALGRVPIIPEQARSDRAKQAAIKAERRARRVLNFEPAEARRLKERLVDERVNARLKEEFGARFVRVRGHAKVMCHLMFGVLALTVDQLVRLIE